MKKDAIQKGLLAAIGLALLVSGLVLIDLPAFAAAEGETPAAAAARVEDARQAPVDTKESAHETSLAATPEDTEPAGVIIEDLRKLMKLRDESEIEYLKKLSVSEQERFIETLRKRLDEETGALLGIMASTARVMPSYLLAKLAPIGGPELAAKMSTLVPIKKGIKIAKHTNREFLADTGYYLDPKKSAAIFEACPDDLLVEVGEINLKRGDYELLASFVEYLSPEKLKTLAMSFDNTEDMLKVAYHMKDKTRLFETTALMEDDDLIEMMHDIGRLGYFEMAAQLSEGLDPVRQARLLELIDPAEAVDLAAHYSPKTLAVVLAKIDRKMAVEVGLRIEPKTLAKIFNLLAPETINQLWPYMNENKVAESLPHLNLLRLTEIWPELNQPVQQHFRRMARHYEPLARALTSPTGTSETVEDNNPPVESTL